jgi:hypothetical protein
MRVAVNCVVIAQVVRSEVDVSLFGIHSVILHGLRNGYWLTQSLRSCLAGMTIGMYAAARS